MSINDARIIELPKFLDVRGNLSFVEQFTHIPFEIRRVYWLYDVPGGKARGGHAEKNNEELIVALSGAFEIIIDDGKQSKTFVLNRSYYGLYIPKGLWREIKEFSTNALALEFGSIPFTADDYIRDYAEFKQYATNYHEDCIISPLPIHKTRQRGPFSVFDCTMVELDKHHSDRKGNLTVVENGFSSVTVPLSSKVSSLPVNV